MKILHLNISDGGGGVGKAGFRLHQALNEAGSDSWMLVDSKLSDDPKVLEASRGVWKKYSPLRAKLDKLPSLFCNTSHWEYASFNFLPNRSVKKAWESLAPDVLHLHWIGDGYLPLQYFPLFAHIPTVATLHGRWLFNGAQHLHSDKSTRFHEGFLRNEKDADDRGLDVDRWVWERKRKFFESNPFEVIALSKWMKKDAERSVLLGNRNIHLVPNGLDLETFCPQDKQKTRDLLGLPRDKQLILFGANFATQDRNKGFHDFVSAIRELEKTQWKSTFEIVVFGSDRPVGEIPFASPVHFLGYLRQEMELVRAYAACDLFVLPSLQDNLPNTVMESMACGTPCVGYDVGGVSDMIDHDLNGYLAKPQDVDDLTAGMICLMASTSVEKQAMNDAARCKIMEQFSKQRQVELTLQAYRSVVQRSSDVYVGESCRR